MLLGTGYLSGLLHPTPTRCLRHSATRNTRAYLAFQELEADLYPEEKAQGQPRWLNLDLRIKGVGVGVASGCIFALSGVRFVITWASILILKKPANSATGRNPSGDFGRSFVHVTPWPDPVRRFAQTDYIRVWRRGGINFCHATFDWTTYTYQRLSNMI